MIRRTTYDFPSYFVYVVNGIVFDEFVAGGMSHPFTGNKFVLIIGAG